MSTICLNMIVKNEAHIIEKTLMNVCQFVPISYWVICDTGSTDDTQSIIRSFFKKKGIDGEIHTSSWQDFGHNRSVALKHAYNKSDYVLIFDGDDSFHGQPQLPSCLNKDAYRLSFGSESFKYFRPVLLNNRIKWKFKGVLHEYLVAVNNDEYQTEETILGDYFIQSGKEGDRSKDPDKYLKDAILLENAIKTETDLELKSRYIFYAAQSFKDYGNTAKAVEFYLQVIEKSMQSQEQYYSCLMVGTIYKKEKRPMDALKYFMMSDQFDAQRLEGLVMACELLLENKMYYFINSIYEDVLTKRINHNGKLFVYSKLYDDHIEFYNSVATYYLRGQRKKSFDLTVHVLINQKADFDKQSLSLFNLQFSLGFIKDLPVKKVLKLFFAVNNILIQKRKLSQVTSVDENTWHVILQCVPPQQLTKCDLYNKQAVEGDISAHT